MLFILKFITAKDITANLISYLQYHSSGYTNRTESLGHPKWNGHTKNYLNIIKTLIPEYQTKLPL